MMARCVEDAFATGFVGARSNTPRFSSWVFWREKEQLQTADR